MTIYLFYRNMFLNNSSNWWLIVAISKKMLHPLFKGLLIGKIIVQKSALRDHWFEICL